MSDAKSCACSGAGTLIFACSGAADVGAIADQTARKLTRECRGKMFCLAGVGGRVPGIMATTKSAEKIIAIDGCPLNCVKACLKQAGFTNFTHLQLADLDMEKGKTPCTDGEVDKAFAAACDKLTNYMPVSVGGNAGCGCSGK